MLHARRLTQAAAVVAITLRRVGDRRSGNRGIDVSATRSGVVGFFRSFSGGIAALNAPANVWHPFRVRALGIFDF